MLIHATKPLFAWEELDDSPTLEDIRRILAALPDAKLLESLRVARGKGRNDYPVGVLWGVEILRIALRHVYMEDCLAEEDGSRPKSGDGRGLAAARRRTEGIHRG